MLMSFDSNSFNESQWLEQLRKALLEETDDKAETLVTIFGVPKTLMQSQPDCYTPQEVAIGPYHHLRPELYDMESYKIAAAKRYQKELQNGTSLEGIVEDLIKHELTIRASYHKPFNFGGKALAWMMAVDACFLFEFFEVCGVKEAARILSEVPSRLVNLIKLSGNTAALNAILRDIIMLENQIPLFVMRNVLKFQCSPVQTAAAEKMMIAMLMGISKELSPFECSRKNMKVINNCAHILDFLYHFIVPTTEVPCQKIDINDDQTENCDKKRDDQEENGDSFSDPSQLWRLLSEVWRILSKLKARPVQLIKSSSKPLKVIGTLPLTIFNKIPVVKKFKEPVGNMLSDRKEDDEDSNSNNIDQPPLEEEIMIPSVSQLLEVGVQFMPTNGGITSIKFDQKTLIFYIPFIKLDVNSKVVLTNLVAYEAGGISGPLFLARYVELMNGIIDTEVDAKLLCERRIIANRLKSEKEVADLWNGMSKSIRLTKVELLDNVIGDVNKFYSGKLKVKFKNFMRYYVFQSWKFLTFLATLALLFLTSFQAFCQVYSCHRIFSIKGLEPIYKQ